MLRSLLFSSFFFFNDTATTEIYTLSLHDALPIFIDRVGIKGGLRWCGLAETAGGQQKNDGRQETECAHELRSEEHTSELQSLAYLVCRLLLEKKKKDLIYILIVYVKKS